MRNAVREFTAGVEIKKGQTLYADMQDLDTSEPLTLVYPLVPGRLPCGIALHDARPWEKIRVLSAGMIGSATATIQIVAGENLESGFVYIGKDGKAYNLQPRYGTRLVVAGADLRKGEMIIFSYEDGGYIPVGPGHEPEGIANQDARKGDPFEMVIRRDADTNTDLEDTEDDL